MHELLSKGLSWRICAENGLGCAAWALLQGYSGVRSAFVQWMLDVRSRDEIHSAVFTAL